MLEIKESYFSIRDKIPSISSNVSVGIRPIFFNSKTSFLIIISEFFSINLILTYINVPQWGECVVHALISLDLI